MSKANIGVFVCACGQEMGGCLDTSALAEQAGRLPGVVWSEQAGYWCLPGGLDRMRRAAAEHNLERLVVAGCAPRTHEALFRQAQSSLNPSLVMVINIRDLCVRPHAATPDLAHSKALSQIAMAVGDLAARRAGQPRIAHITHHAVVIGGGLAGMTAALGLSQADVSVTLVERGDEMGGLARLYPSGHDDAALAAERIAAVRANPKIEVLTHCQVSEIGGPVGRYRLVLSSGRSLETGVIIVATGGQPAPDSLDQAAHKAAYAFVLCDLAPEATQTCSHGCCLATFRQAAELKQRWPDCAVSVLFRELYTAGGTYNELVWQAQQAGVNFVRYPAGWRPPDPPSQGEIVVYDELSGQQTRVACDRLIVAAPTRPQEDVLHLAGMLGLPVDKRGFLADTRVRLRPAERIERGIYVCGAAHYPCDALRAMFEAYSAAARAAQHIQREQLISWAPPAVIDAARCNGCGDCVKVCPFMAVKLVPRPQDRHTGLRIAHQNIPPLAVVDGLVCTGCGNCVSVCPVKAAQVETSYDEQIEAHIRQAMAPAGPSPAEDGISRSPVLLFACEWSGYSAAEVAGAQRLAYPAHTRLIRLNCTGRLQPGLILKALEMGAAGVMILGCPPGVCHYEQGNEQCAAVFEQASALAKLMNMGHRLSLAWLPPDDAAQFVQQVEAFVAQVC